ncbi:hypothetical protein HQ545_02970 [Candidatus Woesearchaeota archaeon]|nr:hypothetical protein [Candidatus Woesearchaeota archaeon]
MPLDNSNIYTFDECSMLKLCKIIVPGAYVVFVGCVVKPQNHDKVNALVVALDARNIPIKFFKPSNFEINSIKLVDELLQRIGNVQMLGDVFRSEILEQIEDFCEKAHDEFDFIEKSDNIELIRQLFVDNERELTREGNIPEDDDLKILAAYQDESCSGTKFFISADEHFWGYDDIISSNCGIVVVKEWECHNLI